MIDVRLLTFMTLIEEKSYTNTAKKLYITQPAVTHHIKSLEKDYNVTLFESDRSFDLTKAGFILLEYAKTQKLQDQLLKNNLEKQKDEYLLINAAITYDAKKVLYNCGKLVKLYNDRTRLELEVCKYEKIIELLEHGKIDFAIVDNSFDSSLYNSMKIFSTKLALVCNPNGQFGFKDRVTREQLLSSNISIAALNTGMRTCTMNALAAKNIKFRNIEQFYFNDIDVMHNQVIMNDSIAFVYYDSVSHLIESKKLKKVELLNFQFSQDIYIIFNRFSKLDDRIVNLLNELQELEV